ncbi:hypothetical protein FZC84_14180 [Rossellomorea vietnamensis]|uniref:Uncharacterized protein n=1 Tax=Rossellomorea vietnamensis TaxID=218284 RepID=A0A5D4MC37_9BACI|nr:MULTISPECIES: hypothetical protein [Bacillaceae]TYR98575.1 hypothetical protein FZC84_14180 [Rossellomorea vietnamensis]
MVNYKLKSHLLEVVVNQLTMNDPMSAGFEINESKEMIASVLTEEMSYMMKNEEVFDEERYAE